MKTTPVLLLAAIVLLSGRECFGQPIVWSGAGDGTTWSDAQNWVGQQVPGPPNNVFITNLAGGAVIITSAVTVESILCSNALTISGGSLGVTAGASLLRGPLTVSNGAVLSAAGSGTSLSSGASVEITVAGLTVTGGAVLALPGATNFQAGCANITWQATGAGSVLELPGLANIQGPTCYDTLTIQGQNGGQVMLNNAVTIEGANGYVSVLADGSNSLVNLPALATNLAALSLEASAGGSVLAPSFAVGGNLNLTLNSGGFISATQFTNFDNGSLYVSGGAVLSLPGVKTFRAGCANITWQATGTGSILEMSGLASLQEPTCYDTLTIEGSRGGQVILSNAVTIESASGYVSVQADGTNSLVNLTALATNLGALSLEASAGGSVLAPDLAVSGNMNVTLNPGGFISAAQFTNVDGASFYVNGGAVLSFPGVVSFQAGCANITWQARGIGSILELPALMTMQEPSCSDTLNIEGSSGGQVILSNAVTIQSANGYVSLQADGTNSLVNLSALATNLGTLSLEASVGGSVLISRLANSGNMNLTLNSGGLISTGQFTNIDGANLVASGGAVLSFPGIASFRPGCATIQWEAVGAGSVLELPALITLQEPTCSDTLTIAGLMGGQVILRNAVTIEAENGFIALQSNGTNSLVNLPALTTNLGALSLEAGSGGSVLTPGLATSGNMSLTLNSGGFVSLAQFTNIDGVSLYANNGAVLSLPGVVSFHSGCGNVQWEAAGVGSVLELPALITLQEPTCSDTLTIQGSSGGQVILSNAVTIEASDGFVAAQADGSNSLVNLPALATNSGALSLEASGGGSVLVPGLAVSGVMGLTLNSGGFISTGQFTNIDGASLYANGGAVLSLPGVAGYMAGCAVEDWEASGAGSILELPRLNSLQGANCGYPMSVQAVSGGQVLLGFLQNISSGDVAFLANDAGSIVSLTNLSLFVLQSGQGSLTEQNGGVILFEGQPLLLYNTTINIPGLNSIPPQTLTLAGTPGHAYRVQEQNTLQPGSPVVTYLVALTNSFQSIAVAPPPNTAFQVTDFIANPPILQIGLTLDNETQLVLFGLTNATYQIQSTTNQVSPLTWMPGSVAVMTNAFRIFPEAPAAAAVRLYRAHQQ